MTRERSRVTVLLVAKPSDRFPASRVGSLALPEPGDPALALIENPDMIDPAGQELRRADYPELCSRLRGPDYTGETFIAPLFSTDYLAAEAQVLIDGMSSPSWRQEVDAGQH